jgi:hypothetical protein
MAVVFMTERGSVEFALIDGYSIGDTLLEGVMFECRLELDEAGEQVVSVNIEPQCAEYFSNLNEKKWLALVHQTVNAKRGGEWDCDSFLAPDGRADAWIEETK